MKTTTVKKPKCSYEITACYGGKFNTGNYEQENNLYSIKEVIECELKPEQISEKQRVLRDLCYAMFKADQQNIKQPAESIIDTAKTIFVPEKSDRDIEKKMNWITLISSCTSVEELKAVGVDIAKKKSGFNADELAEIRGEFNAKKNELTKE
jgi:hypothetical protein